MAEQRRAPRSGSGKGRKKEDPLDKRARELEEVRGYVDETSFAGDQREASDELSAVDQHPADSADMTFQREMDQTVRRIVEVEAEQVRRAQELRKAGKYGICESCGREIAPERLKARPEATLCIECQRERERQVGRR